MITENASLENFQGWDNSLATLASDQDMFAQIDGQKSADDNGTEKLLQPPSSVLVKKDESKQLEDAAEMATKNPAPAKPEESLFEELEAELKGNTKTKPEGEKEKTKPESKSKAEPEVKTKPSNVEMFHTLRKQGLVKVYDEDDFTGLTEEEAELLTQERLAESREESIKEEVAERLEYLPERLVKLNEYVMSGGDMDAFLRLLAKESGGKISDKIDLTNERNQELVIRETMREEGNDEDEIDMHIEFMKEKGTLSTMSEKKLTKWKAARVREKQAMIEAQEEAREQNEIRSRQEKQAYMNLITQSDEIGDVPVPKDIKKTLAAYISDKKIALKGGGRITEFQHDLYYKLPNNKQAVAQLAIFMKKLNKDGTFNTDFLTDRKVTKVTSGIKAGLRHTQDSLPNKSASVNGQDFLKEMEAFYTSSNN